MSIAILYKQKKKIRYFDKLSILCYFKYRIWTEGGIFMIKVRCKKKPQTSTGLLIWGSTVGARTGEDVETEIVERVFDVDTNFILRKLRPGESQEVPCKFCGQTALEVRKDWRGEAVIKPKKMHCKEKPQRAKPAEE